MDKPVRAAGMAWVPRPVKDCRVFALVSQLARGCSGVNVIQQDCGAPRGPDGFWVIDPTVGSMVVALFLACVAGKLPMHSLVLEMIHGLGRMQ